MRVEPQRAVRHRQRDSIVDSAMNLGEDLALRIVEIGERAPGHAFFVVDSAERLGGVGVARARLERENVLGAGNVLRTWQSLEAEIDRAGAEDVELARRIVDAGLVVSGDELL